MRDFASRKYKITVPQLPALTAAADSLTSTFNNNTNADLLEKQAAESAYNISLDRCTTRNEALVDHLVVDSEAYNAPLKSYFSKLGGWARETKPWSGINRLREQCDAGFDDAFEERRYLFYRELRYSQISRQNFTRDTISANHELDFRRDLIDVDKELTLLCRVESPEGREVAGRLADH